MKKAAATDRSLLERAMVPEGERAIESGRNALAIWNAFFAGHWTLASVADWEGQRLLVLKRKKALRAERLTAREHVVLLRAASGLSAKQAAIGLGITVATFSTHLRQCLRKLGLRDRVQLVLLVGGARPARAMSNSLHTSLEGGLSRRE